MMQPSVLLKQWDHLPGRSRDHRIAMVRGMGAFRRIGSAAGILSRRRYTRRRRSRDINTISNANAGGFQSTDREKFQQKLFFLSGVPDEKDTTSSAECGGTGCGDVQQPNIPTRPIRPFIVRSVLPHLLASKAHA